MCGITPLHVAMKEYYSKQISGGSPNFNNYYTGSYYIDPDKDKLALMSAYFPSSRQGADGDAKTAINPHPLGISGPDSGVPPISKRNSYSVKFIQMENALYGHPEDSSIHNKVFYEQGDTSIAMDTLLGYHSEFLNSLNKSDLSEFGSDLFF